MAAKPFRCMVGLHSFVRAHPADERLQGPPSQVCRRCGKRREAGSDVPPAIFT